MRCLLKNGAIVDSNGERKIVHIVTENNKISIVSQSEIEIPANEYDLTGYTIMPGFIHTHVHLFDCFDGFNKEKLRKWTLSGITCLRDEGILSRCPTNDVVNFRNQLKSNCLYPKLMVCGKFISAVNGYGGIAPFEVSTEQEARDAVKQQVNEGVDHIKVSLDKGYDPYTQSLQLLSFHLLEAICNEAHKLGKRVSAHVSEKYIRGRFYVLDNLLLSVHYF